MAAHVIGRFAFSRTFRYFSRKLSRIYLKSKDMHFLKNRFNLQSYISNDVIFRYHSHLSLKKSRCNDKNSLKIHFGVN